MYLKNVPVFFLYCNIYFAGKIIVCIKEEKGFKRLNLNRFLDLVREHVGFLLCLRLYKGGAVLHLWATAEL